MLEVVRSTRGFAMTRPSVLNFEEVVAGADRIARECLAVPGSMSAPLEALSRSYERLVAVAGPTLTSTAGECGTDRRQRERQVDRRAQRRISAGAGETVRVWGHDRQGRTASPVAPPPHRNWDDAVGQRRRRAVAAAAGWRRSRSLRAKGVT